MTPIYMPSRSRPCASTATGTCRSKAARPQTLGDCRDEPAVTRPLLAFFSLTFAATWICWWTSGAISHGTAPASPALGVLAGAVFLLGTFSPALVALALTDRAEGRAATMALLRRVVRWQV